MNYNANGGQRRSSSTKFDFPLPKHKCDLCGIKKENLVESDGWTMQHLHIHEDEEKATKFLTCDKCSNKSPFEFLKKLQNNKAGE